MVAISSLLSPNLLNPKPSITTQSKTPKSLNSLHFPISIAFQLSTSYPSSFQNPRKALTISPCAQQESSTATPTETPAATVDPKSEAARRLYVGNIPRNVTNDQLTQIFQEHGVVEKAEVMYDKYSGRSRRFAFVTMKTVEDANAAIEKLNGTEMGGREIKVNVTEKPLQPLDLSNLRAEELNFVDSPHKIYVGNLAKTVTSDSLVKLFSEKGKVLSAKVSRVPGTSKSSGFGFVTFSSEEDVEAAISAFNNTRLEGQQMRVNKA